VYCYGNRFSPHTGPSQASPHWAYPNSNEPLMGDHNSLPTTRCQCSTNPHTCPSSPYSDPDHLSTSSNENDLSLVIHIPHQWLTAHSLAEWRKERRKKINKRHWKAPDQADTMPRNRDVNKDHLKRCHFVVHILHKNVNANDISRVVNKITGSSPLILSQLTCNIRDCISFCATCPFDHLHLLKGESFGFNVKVSRYHISRDFPAGKLRHSTDMVSDLKRPLPQPQCPKITTTTKAARCRQWLQSI